jgi:hypothetical protein
MIPAFEAAAFFLAIAALLHFSSWAELMLSSSGAAREGAPGRRLIRQAVPVPVELVGPIPRTTNPQRGSSRWQT